MRFAAVSAVAALAGVASAHGHSNGTWASAYTTEVVTAYTTYCPEATELTHAGVTYTVSSASTVTITNCPCTIIKPVTSSVVTSCATCAPSSGFPAPTGWATGSGSAYPSSYATAPTYSVPSPSTDAAASSTSPVASSQTSATNAGSSVHVAGLLVGAGALAALVL